MKIKRKTLLIILVVLAVAGSITYYLFNENRKANEEAAVQENVNNYYNLDDGLVQTREKAEAANKQALDSGVMKKTEEGSFCKKSGFPYETKSTDGRVSCTFGAH